MVSWRFTSSRTSGIERQPSLNFHSGPLSSRILALMKTFLKLFSNIYIILILCQRPYIHTKKADIQPNLRGSQTNTVSTVHGLVHIVNQFLKVGVIFINILTFFS